MEMVPQFLSVCALLLLHMRDRKVDVVKTESSNNAEKRNRRIPPDVRVLQCCEEELAARPRFVLDLGSGFGDRARMLADKLRCTVVAFESDPSISMKASEQTQSCGLTESVWHVRCDPQLSVDAQDVIEGNYYDAVVISTSFSWRKGALAWASLALREGGVMIVEGNWKVYEVMKNDLGLEQVRICQGGTLESLESPRRFVRQRIASYDGSAQSLKDLHQTASAAYDVEPYFLICGLRTASQAPLTVRPRTLSAITFSVSTGARAARVNSTLFEKPVTTRRRDQKGRRLRVGCVCVCPSSSDPGRPDLRKLVVISSSKRPGEWILPAGGLEEGEQGETAALREAYEESGCQGRVLASLSSWEDSTKQSLTDFFLVLVDHLEEDFPEKANRKVALVHIEDAIQLVSNPGAKHALALAKVRFLS